MLLDLIGLRLLASPRRWRSFLFSLEKRIFSRFKAFSFFGGIIYQLGKENAAGAKFDKNNFFGILTIKFFLCENQQVRLHIEKF
jgi:hypothetical protein